MKNFNSIFILLAVKRALKMRHPTWYHKNMKDENIKKISVGLTCFHFIIVLPNGYFYKVEDNFCRMRSDNMYLLRAYQLTGFVIFSLGHFVAIIVSNGFFIRELWRKRKSAGSAASIPKNTDLKTRTNTAPAKENGASKKDISIPMEDAIFDSTDVIYCGPNSFICTNFAQKKEADEAEKQEQAKAQVSESLNKNNRKTIKKPNNDKQKRESTCPSPNVGKDRTKVEQANNPGEITRSLKKVNNTEQKMEINGNLMTVESGVKKYQETLRRSSGASNLSVNKQVIGNSELSEAPGTSSSKKLDQKAGSKPWATNKNSTLNKTQKSMLTNGSGPDTPPYIEVDPPTRCPDPSKAVRKVSRTIKRAVSHLSREDWTALTTILFVCIWYLFSSLLSIVILHVTDWMDNATITISEREFLRSVSRLLMIVNNSVNFLFYYRAQSVKDALKRRWFYWTTCCCG